LKIITILTFILILEIIIFLLTKKLSKSKWIITKKKLSPLFNKFKFNFFKKNNYNYYLGWDKKPQKKNYDILDNKKIFYSIDKKGFRFSNNKKKKNTIVTFGDSYTFGRQVNDNETWQELICNKKKIFISNYGVGNYGLDQAYLKYKKTKLSKNTKIVIFGIVPETICRIQSCWKNYLEFGNIHGFKPFCKIINNKFLIFKNPLKPSANFSKLIKVVKKTQKIDRFYKEKYLKNLLKFPYLFYFLRNFSLNLKIYYKFIITKNKDNISEINSNLFPIIMKNNIKLSHKLYKEDYSKNLLDKLLYKIQNETNKKNLKCYFVIFPQLYDLEIPSRENYQKFFNNIKNKYNVIDLTSDFLKKKYHKLYINDKYGGHLNKNGNIFVSNIINRIT
jgi:hypothetical protein